LGQGEEGRVGAMRKKKKYPQCARTQKRSKNIPATTNFSNELLFLNQLSRTEKKAWCFQYTGTGRSLKQSGKNTPNLQSPCDWRKHHTKI